MANRFCVAVRFQEAVSAVAGVFNETVTGRDALDAMAEDPAQVAHFLGEQRAIGEWIGARRVHERMAAFDADVFVSAVPV